MIVAVLAVVYIKGTSKIWVSRGLDQRDPLTVAARVYGA
jgi:hypothetical protein